MRKITLALLARANPPAGPLVDLGCGGGGLLAELTVESPPYTLCGVDIDVLALSYASRRVSPLTHLVRSDLQELPFAPGSQSVVLALDAFDQKQVNLRAALAESWRILAPRGMLIMRLSAYPWLHSQHDRAFRTGQRVDKHQLLHNLTIQGFCVEYITHANSLLALPVILWRLGQRWVHLPVDAPFFSENRLFRWLVKRILWLEASWLRQRNLLFGVSLYVIARKPG